jgi:diguanylate cyclase (GGDEF)-like protein
MLAELDRAILNASQIEYVILEVLNHIREAIPCDGAGLMTLGESGRAVLITCHEGRSLGCKRTPVGDYDLTQPDQTRDMIRIRPDSLTSDCLACLSSRPLAELLAFPVYGENRTEHVLVLAYAMPPRDVEGIAQSARALTDRLALAFSSFAQEEKLYHQAHYDALTDLPNRVLLRDRVEQALVRAGRNGTGVALILIDLDNFKQVNDLQGHSSGDMLLVKCAMRLKLKIRQEDTLARLGGDEFVILVEGRPRGEEVAILDGMLRKLGDSLSKPIALGERELVVTGSMGIALYPENASHFEELLKMADAAMYTSKRKQPGGFHFYTSDINSHSQRRFELTQELRQAVERDELTLHYQAKFDAETGHLVGAEALVRWNSPRRGLVLPGEFLQSLEEMGLGVWLGEWVLEHTCRQMRAWEDGGLPSIQISINLSPAQFERAQIVELVQANLDRYRVGAERLQIEILEATAVGSIKSVQDSLYRLHEMGISIALDDFGTGYSSLVYLTRIPANVLKLDRAFILTLADDKRQYEIVKRIISLAKVLDYSIVAEGVEDDTQRKLLAGMGCDHIQGYLCSRPIPADEFAEHWLAPLAAPTDQARFPRRAEGRTTSEFG